MNRAALVSLAAAGGCLLWLAFARWLPPLPGSGRAVAAAPTYVVYLPEIPDDAPLGSLNPTFSPTPIPSASSTAAPTATSASTASASPTATPTSAGPYTVQYDVTYCTPDYSGTLAADVYTPLSPTTSMPLIIYIHGGEWIAGDKSEITSPIAAPTLDDLTANGYVVASINYRLAPNYLFPAMIEDAKCAVRYFRANAAQYGIDATRIGAWGSSAGGHLVDLLGTTDTSAGWDVGEWTPTSSRVEAVADWYGVTDLQSEYLTAIPNKNDATTAIVEAFGNASPTTLSHGSPLFYVTSTSDDAPVIIDHGNDDSHVYFSQSVEFATALAKATMTVALTPVQNAEHQFTPYPPGATIVPSIDEIATGVLDFFNTTLKNNPNPQPQGP